MSTADIAEPTTRRVELLGSFADDVLWHADALVDDDVVPSRRRRSRLVAGWRDGVDADQLDALPPRDRGLNHARPGYSTSEPDRRAEELTTMGALESRKVAFLTANEGVEQVELTEPWSTVEREGGIATLIAPEAGTVQAFNHLDKGDTFDAALATRDADVESFDALVLPGGVANPDQLRLDNDAVRLVREFVIAGKPIAVICHGPWTLVEADVVEGRTLTSWPSLRTDVINARGNWIDDEVVVCDNGPNTIVSSRKPDDLPAFTKQLVDVFSR